MSGAAIRTRLAAAPGSADEGGGGSDATVTASAQLPEFDQGSLVALGDVGRRWDGCMPARGDPGARAACRSWARSPPIAAEASRRQADACRAGKRLAEIGRGARGTGNSCSGSGVAAATPHMPPLAAASALRCLL